MNETTYRESYLLLFELKKIKECLMSYIASAYADEFSFCILSNKT